MFQIVHLKSYCQNWKWKNNNRYECFEKCHHKQYNQQVVNIMLKAEWNNGLNFHFLGAFYYQSGRK